MRNSIFSISLNKRKISLAYQQRRMQFAQKELLSSFAIACQNFATQHTSVASLKGHLSPEAISYLLVSTVYLERLCYRLSSVTNVSPHLDLVSEESGQPYKAGGVVPYCALPISNPLRAVYDSGAMHRALEAAIGVPVFSYDLPYGAVNAIFMRHGENQNWHFDFADFTFILFLRTVKIGGQFSYRAASNEEFCALPNLNPGDVVLIAGNKVEHGVTLLESTDGPRISVTWAFSLRPDRVAPTHIKRLRYGLELPQ